MKLEIIRNMQFTETLVKIYAAHIDQKTQKVIDLIENNTVYIQGRKNDKTYFINLEGIIRFYTADKKVYFVTAAETYRAKQRLYQLEEQLPSNFVKISQGEIVNISYIQKLDLSMRGSICVIFKNGSSSFVSRRCIKAFKRALDL
ncbi:LytTR family DNA-binding domain-containing protein [Streptococcus dentiloxodontae]